MRFILNPFAGRLKKRGILRRVLNWLTNFHGPSQIMFTKGKYHAAELAYRSVLEGADKIISVGGDGTLNEIIEGTSGQRVPLGLVPMGSGNDFARALGLHGHPFHIIRGLSHFHIKKLDAASVNDHYFMNVMGTGIDAEVIRLLEGKRNYLTGFYHALRDHKARDYKIEIDGKIHYFKDVNGIFVANGQYFGNRMRISPTSVLDDGLLDLLVIHGLKRAKLFLLFPKIYFGLHLSHKKNIEVFRAEKICIKAPGSVDFQRDGEIFTASSANIEVKPGEIEFLIP